MSQPNATPATPALPLFYRRPKAMDPAQHGRLRLGAPDDFRFARKANAVAVLGPEFPQAARFYPIVFTPGANALPAVVLGLKTDDNLLVDANGRWEAATYVPAYVRRYPFIFVEAPDHQRFTLCIDEAAEQLSTDGPRPLFDGSQPAAATREALEMCKAFQRDATATQAFVQALEAKELLVERRADVALDHGERLALAGFRVIDEARFNALDDATFLDWRRRGWVGLVYCHLLSGGNWAGLVERAARRAAQG